MKISNSIYDWLIAIVATIVGLLLSMAVIQGVLSFIDYLKGSGGDFEYTDIYQRVAQRRSVAVLSDDVAIVSVDGCSREEIAEVIDAVSFMSPAAVGLDIFFTYPSEDGLEVASAVQGCDGIILPVAVGRSDSRSFFYGDFPADFAAVNMLSSSSADIIRDYSTLFNSDSTVYPSMAHALVAKAGYDVEKPDTQNSPIWYPSVEFDVVEAREIVGPDGFPNLDVADRLDGKMVLIGLVDDPGDVHRTPIDDQMPGTRIHAHIVDTIVNSRSVREVSAFWNIVIAFIVCVLFIRLTIFLKSLWDDVGEMLMKLGQLLLIYVFLVLGAHLYIEHMIFFDFSLTIVVLGLSMTVMALIKGSIYIYNKYAKK